jgi:hypothetical protein
VNVKQLKSYFSMPRSFSLFSILLIGAAIALTIPFLTPANLSSNPLKRFFSRAKPRLKEATQPQIQGTSPINTSNMTKTPVYFISHGKPPNPDPSQTISNLNPNTNI